MDCSTTIKTNQPVFDIMSLFSKIIHKNTVRHNTVCELYRINIQIPKLTIQSIVNLDLTNPNDTYLSIEYHSQR